MLRSLNLHFQTLKELTSSNEIWIIGCFSFSLFYLSRSFWPSAAIITGGFKPNQSEQWLQFQGPSVSASQITWNWRRLSMSAERLSRIQGALMFSCETCEPQASRRAHAVHLVAQNIYCEPSCFTVTFTLPNQISNGKNYCGNVMTYSNRNGT